MSPTSLLRRLTIACLAIVVLCASVMAQATPPSVPLETVDAIRSNGVLRCGGVPRPGLASVDAAGRWSGLEVELCRAVAAAVLGSGAPIAWRSYESEHDFDHVRAGDDRLSFLSDAEIAQHKLAGVMRSGSTVFVETLDILVAGTSSAKRIGDLAGQTICFIIGTAAEDWLEDWFAARKLEFIPRAFQEDDEMYDAFNVQRCKGLAGELTTLAAARRDRGINGLTSRALPGHLDAYPIVAVTPLTSDARWAAVVAATLDALSNDDAGETGVHPGSARLMSIDRAALGLAPGWDKTVIGEFGSYAEIFRRTLGSGSPLQLNKALDGGSLSSP